MNDHWMSPELSLLDDELERYDRQIMMTEIGPDGQKRLKKAKVLIAGAGGLGSSIAFQLTAAGVGTLVMIDHDRVTLSNLNRQILHGTMDVGELKVDSAKQALGRLNPYTRIQTDTVTIDWSNVHRLAEGCNLIIDALDNLAARFMLNHAAVNHGIPFIHGAVNGFEGRLLTVIPGQSACLQCIMHRGSAAATARFPVLGVTPAVIGTLQAAEAIKCLLNIGAPLAGRLVHFDGLSMTWKEFKVKMNPDCSHCGHLQPKERKPL